MSAVSVLTDEDLFKLAQSYHKSIFQEGCYGIGELIRYHEVSIELLKRGYFMEEKKELVINKI